MGYNIKGKSHRFPAKPISVPENKLLVVVAPERIIVFVLEVNRRNERSSLIIIAVPSEIVFVIVIYYPHIFVGCNRNLIQRSLIIFEQQFPGQEGFVFCSVYLSGKCGFDLGKFVELLACVSINEMKPSFKSEGKD